MNQSPSTPRNLARNLLFFSVLLCALLVSVWARAAQVTLVWDANTESDLAGYRIHYGTASGCYTVTVEVDKSTPTCTILNLSDGQTYYFAASAYTASGAFSGYSNEVSYAISAPNTAPSSPAIPSGTTSGVVNRAIAFTTSATDPEGQSLNTVMTGAAAGSRAGRRRRSRANGRPPGSTASRPRPAIRWALSPGGRPAGRSRSPPTGTATGSRTPRTSTTTTTACRTPGRSPTASTRS